MVRIVPDTRVEGCESVGTTCNGWADWAVDQAEDDRSGVGGIINRVDGSARCKGLAYSY